MNLFGKHSSDERVSYMKLFMGAASVLVFVTMALLISVFVSSWNVHRELQRARSEFDQLQPEAEKLRAVQRAETANRSMMEDFHQWSRQGGLPMYQTLRAVQESIPVQMVLYHFTAGIEAGHDEDALVRSLYVSGSADDEQAAIEAKRKLNSDDRLRDFCGEIRLVTTHRYSGRSRAISFEGSLTVAGGVQ